MEPVLVAWDGRLRFDARGGSREGPVSLQLTLEGGGERSWQLPARELVSRPDPRLGGTLRRGQVPHRLPPGYHRLQASWGERSAEALVVSAPRRCFPGEGVRRDWGVFLPLYALHSRRSWGAGDLGDLRELLAWARGLGGGFVGTLPLFASFLEEPFDPSPYAPASRLFWNEFYAHLETLPELEASPEAKRLLESTDLQEVLGELRASPTVDYGRQMAYKRRLLQELARAFFAGAPEARRRGFEGFLASRPEAAEYAAFRAFGELRRRPWQAWPEPQRSGRLAPGEADPEAEAYHLYAQWVTAAQLGDLRRQAGGQEPGLYLDLPLGAHAGSFDVWRHRGCYAPGVSAGAPPDPFFTRGQDWGFPPPHPEGDRRAGYPHLRAILRNLCRHAGAVRLDHAMQLHRLFWIPAGAEAADGTYVRYPAEELYAILCLESQRARTIVVGENLGTVPAAVNRALRRRGVRRMFVLQYEADADREPPIPPAPEDSLACLNTHDMPTFQGFWRAADLALREELGLLDPAAARREADRRGRLKEAMVRQLAQAGRLPGGTAPGGRRVLRAALAELAASPAHLLAVNLEDLWGEEEPQNVPGTGAERPNWRRKARLSLEELTGDREILDTLREIDRLRQDATER